MVVGHGERLQKRAQRLPGSPWVDADAVAGGRFKLGEMVNLLWRSWVRDVLGNMEISK